MIINKWHGSYNRSRRSGNPQYICVHYTAGTGSAKNNCQYFAGGNRNASADYFIDDTGIWEYNDPGSGFYTWAVGDGKGKYGITNANSCHIEVVNTGGLFSAREISYLTELVQHLMQRFGITAAKVVRHYDASRKLCPYAYAKDTSAWNALHAQITTGSAKSGKWIKDGNGWWYQWSDGTYPTSSWLQISGVWYYFNSAGYAVTDWQSIGGQWYLFDANCQMLTGWRFVNSRWYYLSDSGAMAVGWLTLGVGASRKWYYLDGSGAMVTGWQKIGNIWYYFETSTGAMFADRWVGNYYLSGDGSMATNRWVDGGRYFVNAAGLWDGH